MVKIPPLCFLLLLPILELSMDNGEGGESKGYAKPPWIFKGRALYQLHLVKAETVRACIPKELKLVQAFGYTLGGFFLADYHHSPAGPFHELVVIAGLVWNPPTSCAWATKVFVNSDEACKHGRREVGLPSYLATFSSKTAARSLKMNNAVRVTPHGSSSSFNLNHTRGDTWKWLGPSINMSLPSFSGRTDTTPHLLNYSCNIHSRVRPVSPAQVLLSSSSQLSDDDNNTRSIAEAVMLSKPILALKFSSMTMQVEAPDVVSHSPTSLSPTS